MNTIKSRNQATNINEAVALTLGYPNVRKNKVVGSLVSENDVFGVLPTGWEKLVLLMSPCYIQPSISIYLYLSFSDGRQVII